MVLASGQAPLDIQFTAGVAGGVPPYVYTWDFGDGSAAASGNPVSHTYQSAGAFQVSVAVADAIGEGVSASGTVDATAPAGCVGTDGSFLFYANNYTLGQDVAVTVQVCGASVALPAPASLDYAYAAGPVTIDAPATDGHGGTFWQFYIPQTGEHFYSSTLTYDIPAGWTPASDQIVVAYH